jgi:hypothetical protein
MASKIFGLVDVLEYTVQDYVTKDVLFTVDYATTVGFASNSETLDIRGGIANPVLLSTNHTKTFELTSELPLIDIDLLAHKLGTAVTEGTTVAPKTEKVMVSATNTITFSQTPVASTLKLYVLAENGNMGTTLTAGDPDLNADEYELLLDEATLNVAVVAGTMILAVYDYSTGVTAREISVTAKDFPSYIRVTGKGYLVDKFDGSKVLVAFEVYKAKVDPSFELSAGSGDASSINFNVMGFAEDVRQPNGCIIKKFANIVQLPDEVIVCE